MTLPNPDECRPSGACLISGSCIVHGAVPPILIWTDGSGTVLEEKAGIGVYIKYPDGEDQKISESIGCGTNNIAELTAIYRALLAVRRDAVVIIHSDSQYAIGSLTKNWVAKKNQELIAKIRAELALHPYVTFVHVRGHQGIEGNEIADELAKAGRLSD